MQKISIIGGGRVATHMCVALSDKADELISVNSRTLEDLPLDSDIYIISVSDDAIEQVAARLPRLAGIVAHTSGSVPMDILAPYADRYGVFYPLQTFTKGVEPDYARIPFFIEGNTPDTAQALQNLASLISTNVYSADSARRKKLHIASVFACNYVNYMFNIASHILEDEGLSLDVLHPLIQATVDKIQRMSPQQAQTGPASRGDMKVIAEHIKALSDTPYAETYKLLASGIINQTNNECD